MKSKFLITFLLLITTVSFAETVTTNAGNVPLQKNTSDTCVIELIPLNTSLEKLGTSGAFYNVNFNGTNGWISKTYTIEGVKEAQASTKIPDITSVPKVNGSSIVKTDMSNSLPAVNEEQLSYMINTYCKGARRSNLIRLTSSFIKMQETYKVNAVFAVAASICESGGGTNGKLITTYKSYNLFSIKGSYNGKSVAYNGSTWKRYPGFDEAIMDFGRLIAEGTHYFKNGKYTPVSIGVTYCNTKWGVQVANIMNSMYSTLSK